MNPKECLVRGVFFNLNGKKLDGRCFDYHKAYFYPYELEEGEFVTSFLIVDKESGRVFPIDPLYDAEEFNRAKLVMTFDPSDISEMAGKMLKRLEGIGA